MYSHLTQRKSKLWLFDLTGRYWFVEVESGRAVMIENADNDSDYQIPPGRIQLFATDGNDNVEPLSALLHDQPVRITSHGYIIVHDERGADYLLRLLKPVDPARLEWTWQRWLTTFLMMGVLVFGFVLATQRAFEIAVGASLPVH
jgi:hypothetical protein